MQRAAIEVTGLVQGVGFRPFVYSLATSLGLRGYVQNRGAHVFVDAEGDADALHALIDRLTVARPSGASIDRVESRSLSPAYYQQFVIAQSQVAGDTHVRVPPDVATCHGCLEELFAPGNRRFRYPFITCTACGPRFSIVETLPYDRAGTTMAAFDMCRACLVEYSDPLDRRFHAQTIACPRCGPVLLAREQDAVRATGDAALSAATEVIRTGGIIGIKGLGGFHLACDASNEAVVAELRRRKGREAKPFAVMFSEAEGRRLAAVEGHDALAAVLSPERPIVLVTKSAVRAPGQRAIADNVAPRCATLGVILPYTPVHHLLLHEVGRPLVMTSGNLSDEPMVYREDVALDQLGHIADLFLTHDRRIEVRCDDTVVRASARGIASVRRARGHAPAPVVLAEESSTDLLALGGHLKNTFCLVRGSSGYVSQHIGHLETLASYKALGDAVSHMSTLLNLAPEVIAHDQHPDYLSTRLAHELPAVRRVAVQHHHAHVLSCVAEHRCVEPVIGVAFDGAGLGTDGAIWGGEFLIVDGIRCRRAAHLAYVPLPGGDVAAREPWRMAVSHLRAAYDADLGPLGPTLASRVGSSRLGTVRQMIERAICSPPTSSMGRLFDAVAALVGVGDEVGFEGQAAMELEAMGTAATSRRYEFDLDTRSAPWQIHAAPVIRNIAADVIAEHSPRDISAAWHEAVAAMIATVAARLARETGIRRVVLSGGVFQNALLSERAARALAATNLEVLEHRCVPCNDGGLSLGQALLALRMVRADRVEEDRAACA